MPLISVLIPSYNHQSYIAAAIESVQAQTYSNWEIIIVDDASTDQTWSAIQRFQDPRIKAFRQTQNKGAVICLDEALSQCSGDYIAILNSDDCYHPERLDKVLAYFDTNNCSAVFTDVRFIDEHSAELPHDHPRKRDYQRLINRKHKLHCSSWFLSGNPAISTSNLFYKRDALRSTWSTFQLRYTHDWAWCLEQSAYGHLGWLREPLVDYRVHQHNTVHEPDVWRHRHENAWILGYAIELLPIISARYRDEIQVDEGLLINTLCEEFLFNQYASSLMGLMIIARARILNANSFPPFSSLLSTSESSWWAESLMRSAGFYDTDPMETMHELLARQGRERALWEVTSDLTSQLVQTKADPAEKVYQMVQLHQDLRELSSAISTYQDKIQVLQGQVETFQNRTHHLQAEVQVLKRSKVYRIKKFLRYFCCSLLKCLPKKYQEILGAP